MPKALACICIYAHDCRCGKKQYPGSGCKLCCTLICIYHYILHKTCGCCCERGRSPGLVFMYVAALSFKITITSLHKTRRCCCRRGRSFGRICVGGSGQSGVCGWGACGSHTGLVQRSAPAAQACVRCVGTKASHLCSVFTWLSYNFIKDASNVLLLLHKLASGRWAQMIAISVRYFTWLSNYLIELSIH